MKQTWSKTEAICIQNTRARRVL